MNIFKLSVSAAASEFCYWVHVEIDVYIPLVKYQVFQQLLLLPLFIEITFFIYTNGIIVLNLK